MAELGIVERLRQEHCHLGGTRLYNPDGPEAAALIAEMAAAMENFANFGEASWQAQRPDVLARYTQRARAILTKLGGEHGQG